jgi:hypothetical protein
LTINIIGTGSGNNEPGLETDGDANENINGEPFLEMPVTRKELALSWVSYAVGIVMGRFTPGVKRTLGSSIEENTGVAEKHLFPIEVENALRSLAVPSAIAMLDSSHQEDLAYRVRKALNLMLGKDQVNQIVTALGGEVNQVDESLRRFLERDFFKAHVKWYRKRPVYWLLQSPEKKYSVFVYYEQMTRDTLFLFQGNRYLGAKINATRQRIDEIRQLMHKAQGREKKQLEKDLTQLGSLLNDVEAFDQNLRNVLGARNERNETVGWVPEIDDGIIINLAPLHELIPSWKAEPNKHWEKLKAGDYDWSCTAMRYWPGRVLEKCRINKSFAIAHGTAELI